MILKHMDDRKPAVAELERLLAKASGERKAQVAQELRTLKAGIKGEQESAYLIDFDFKDRKNSIVIHDLRLEHRGGVAQIDHLIMTRTLDCYVLETKHFASGMKITDEGEFLRWNDYKKAYEGMASPLAQNERHITVLRDVFSHLLLATRFGIQLAPTFHSVVLVSPKARIDRPKRFDTSAIVKADAFSKQFDKDIDDMGILTAIKTLSKVVGADTLQTIGRQLIARHKPVAFDYATRFGGGNEGAAEAAKPSAPAAPAGVVPDNLPGAGSTCRSCGQGRVAIQYGKFGYYFKCADCDGNTPIKVSCGKPGHRERIRKEGRNFYRDCAECGTSQLFFTNPV